MKLATVFAFALAAVAVHASPTDKRLSCAEASRFGNVQVVPTNLQPGTDFTINVNLECAVEYFGIIPRYTDFYIEVPEPYNNGHEPAILLARRDYTLPAQPLSPNFNFTAQVREMICILGQFIHFLIQLPHYPYTAGASYTIFLSTTYPINGTDGSEVLIQGGVYTVVNITST
ncbi:hypothetical protein EDD18DRAFT_463064 [Armillaria luteobubalina]|uniref:Ubiquitin 3 binding protein But2 C-terminal domain-containing protein n=1 Tax=Armillaria luteobubalina TaxID=153913 RepID=A0AA39PXU4_9AGAR|nr:hypothetical protein EDD18DRAFT_463064 [Armillaria luteobubalina]